MRSMVASPDAVTHAGSRRAHGDGASEAMACPRTGAPATFACTVHCADHAKDSQIAKAPTVPMLPIMPVWPVIVRPEPTPRARVAAPGELRTREKRPTQDRNTVQLGK